MEDFDLSEWWLVLTNGQYFCGRLKGSTLHSLQKAELPMGLAKSEQGNPVPTISVMTYPWLLDQIEVPPGSLKIAIEAFYNPQQWSAVIQSTEKLKLARRAQRAGLLIASSH